MFFLWALSISVSLTFGFILGARLNRDTEEFMGQDLPPWQPWLQPTNDEDDEDEYWWNGGTPPCLEN